MLGIGLTFAFHALAQSNNPRDITFRDNEFLVYTYKYEDNVFDNTYPRDVVPDQTQPRMVKATLHGMGVSCVTYAYEVTGLPVRGYGSARNVPTNSDIPSIGGIVKTNESKYGHLAVIADIQDGELILNEANLDFKGNIFKGRRMKIGDKRIKGYIN